MPAPKSSEPSVTEEGDALVRLQKVLASAGVGSRRHCEEYIAAGRVSVDGEVIRSLGVKVDPDKQKIAVDGLPVKIEKKVYYLLNKPVGFISTNEDPAGRQRVIDLFPKSRERLFTVGRLDENSQGLMIVTNDGELANKLAHPRYGVPKTYRVQTAGIPTREELQQLRQGLEFREGIFKVRSVRLVETIGKSSLLEIVLTEGQNREIRRLLAKIGHKVMRLERVEFGPLKLLKLPLGKFRHLTSYEVKQLWQWANGVRTIETQPTPRKVRKRKRP